MRVETLAGNHASKGAGHFHVEQMRNKQGVAAAGRIAHYGIAQRALLLRSSTATVASKTIIAHPVIRARSERLSVLTESALPAGYAPTTPASSDALPHV